MSTPVQEKGKVDSYLDSLADSLVRLDDTITNLRAKVAPALCSEPKPETANTGKDAEACSGLVERIRGDVEKLDELVGRIAGIIEECEL